MSPLLVKASRPCVSWLCALVLATLLSSCQFLARRETIKIGIDRITHIAAGQSVQLSAYQEFRLPSKCGVPNAASTDLQSEPVVARWSVSDNTLAKINDQGTLVALKPGKMTVKSVWKNYEAEASIEIVKDLPGGFLPKLTSQGTNCKPHVIDLDLTAEHTLRFYLNFADKQCQDVIFEKPAPQQQFPWTFEIQGGTLELREAHGQIVNGDLHLGAGQISFTVWSNGGSAYPLSLANKTVLLTGDSMAEGIGWSMKKKVEDAGGHIIVQPVYSSTTVQWQDEGRIREYIERFNPDIIFVALGSNEIFVTDLEARAKAVRGISADIGSRPAYWIGPPSWKPDKGIVRVIEENFKEGHFYNSNSLVVPRRKDGAHPTVEGYKIWTELIWTWYARIG